MFRGRITLVYLLGMVILGGCNNDANLILNENLKRSTEIVEENSHYLHNYLISMGAESMRAQPMARVSNSLTRGELLFESTWHTTDSKAELLSAYHKYELFVDSICRIKECDVDLIEISDFQGLSLNDLKQVLRFRVHELSYNVRSHLSRFVDVGSISCGFGSLYSIDSLNLNGNTAEVFVTTIAANLGEDDWVVYPFEIRRNGEPFEHYPIKSTINPQNVFQFSQLPPGDYQVSFNLGNVRHPGNQYWMNDSVLEQNTTTFTIPSKE